MGGGVGVGSDAKTHVWIATSTLAFLVRSSSSSMPKYSNNRATGIGVVVLLGEQFA
jgi:hypothetical protein